MRFMTLLDELHLLVSQLRLHVAQEYPAARVSLPKPVSVAATAPAPVAKPVFSPKKDAAVIKPEPKVEKVEPLAAKQEVPLQPLHPTLSLLCRPLTKPHMPPLDDCLAKFEKAKIKCLEAPVVTPNKAFSYPKLLFVSFFIQGSNEEQFIQKVKSACDTKLTPSEHYRLPTLEMAAEVYTLCATGSARAVILVYDQATQHKMANWLALFGEDLQPSMKEIAPLLSKKGLFNVPFYELALISSEDHAFKSALWKALQATV